MHLQTIISRYARYNYWANETLMQWLQTLESNLLYKETPSSFGTILLTLQHIARAQNFWLAIITGADIPHEDDATALNIADITNDLLAGSQRMLNMCKEYTEEDLLQPVSSNDMVQSRYEYILHAINHNAYHRGQIVTMSRCLGVLNNIPAMDYEVFLWLECS